MIENGKQATDDGLDMREVARLVDEVMAEDDANDPTLEFYQREYGSPDPVDGGSG